MNTKITQLFKVLTTDTKTLLPIFCILATTLTHANEDAELAKLIKEHDQHQEYTQKITRQIEIYELKLKSQELQTNIQKRKIECIQAGGCLPSRVVNTSIKDKVATSLKNIIKLNAPLPIIDSIIDNKVTFKGDSISYSTNDIFDIWLITAIYPTFVELTDSTSKKHKIYFYWK